MILSFRTDRSEQTVKTQIKLHILDASYSMVKPSGSKLRVIITNVLGVRIFTVFQFINLYFTACYFQSYFLIPKDWTVLAV